MINAMLDKERDVLLTGSRTDIECVKCFLTNLHEAAELTGKLFSESRIFTDDDAEELMVTCTLLVNHNWDILKRDLDVEYAIRLMSRIAVAVFVDNDGRFTHKWMGNECLREMGVSRMEMLLHVCRLTDMYRHYWERIE